ncbi:hypothetical protein PV10_02438 [Exophiala mesophila]|uniref:F-box domain-containing protein n=1 Tax=Exophiala mesophila TaxID=212818 RepID=A0A0D2A6Q9_EXOME|nr:uncharacterized protein PV10_02438 [Exophiala mesophila]KIV94698.1 hypothetical protein PV10_02438 [Exophiala mesophila]
MARLLPAGSCPAAAKPLNSYAAHPSTIEQNSPTQRVINSQANTDLARASSFDLWCQQTLHPASKPPKSPVSRTTAYDPFFIPRHILFNSTNTQPQPQCKLLQLPQEILTHIFQSVKIPYFQVCLALTCKSLGRVATGKNAMAPWRGYRDKDGLFRLLERNHYIPPTLRLCRGCFTFVPRSEDYWIVVLTSPEYDAKDISWCDIFNFFQFQGHTSSQHRCPRCVARKHFVYFSQAKYELDRRIRSQGDFNDECFAVCPELDRRIDKP